MVILFSAILYFKNVFSSTYFLKIKKILLQCTVKIILKNPTFIYVVRQLTLTLGFCKMRPPHVGVG